MKKVLFSCLLAVLLISVLLVGACSSTTSTTTSQAPAPPSSSAPAPAPSSAPAPAPTPAAAPYTKQFVIALGGHAQGSLDPVSGQQSPDISANVFDTLMCYSPDKKLTSNICSSWTVLDGGKKIEFKVKPGIKFSTGDPLTAADIDFSWQRLMKINHFGAGQVPSFDHTAVVDDQTIDFYFTSPTYGFIGLSQDMLFIVSKANYDKVGEDAYVQNPIGTGPYKFAGWKMNEYTDLVVNDNYYGPKPQIQKARFVIASDDSTRIAMLKAGEADFITNVPYQIVASLQKDGFTKAQYLMPLQIGIQFVLTNPNAPWAKLEVRQAINYAIDKDALIKTVYAGIPPKAAWLEPWEPGYDPSLQPAYPYDLAKAKQLMSDAGYANGFDWPFVYLSNVAGSKDATDFLASALKQININLKPQAMVMDPSLFDVIGKWHSDPTSLGSMLTEAAIAGNPDPSIGMNMMLLGSNPFVTGGNPELDAVITKINNSADPAERAALIKQAFTICNNYLPYIPFIGEEWVCMMKSNVSYVPHAYQSKGTDNLKDLTVK
jgi:peptide/nickel transport system substrate-binding protein